jgi:hypothetical protein
VVSRENGPRHLSWPVFSHFSCFDPANDESPNDDNWRQPNEDEPSPKRRVNTRQRRFARERRGFEHNAGEWIATNNGDSNTNDDDEEEEEEEGGTGEEEDDMTMTKREKRRQERRGGAGDEEAG